MRTLGDLGRLDLRWSLVLVAIGWAAACHPGSGPPGTPGAGGAAGDSAAGKGATGATDGGVGTEPEGGRPDTPQGGTESSTGATAGNGGAPQGGTSAHEPGAGGGEGQPTSKVCGDAIRDPLLEACDDGPGSDEDSCNTSCAVSSYPVVPRETGRRTKSRSLGFGRHSIAAGEFGSGVVFVESADSTTTVWLNRFDVYGRRVGARVNAGADAAPGDAADPVLTALPGGAWAVAFADASNGSLDVALRRFDGAGVRTATRVANATKTGSHYSPDLIWAGGALHATWSENLAIKTRAFSDALEPLSDEIPLFNGPIQGSASVVEHGAGVAVAARIQDGSAELIEIVAGDVRWLVGPFIPGAPLERPALVSVSDDFLVLAFTEGTDPLATGIASVSRLSLALLDVSAPGVVAPLGDPSIGAPGSDVTLAQRRPALVRAGSHHYLAWENDTRIGDANAQGLRLQEFAWDEDASALTWSKPQPFSAAASNTVAQRAPAMAATPLFPQGAIATVWEEIMAEGVAAPDIIFSLRPSPFVFQGLQ